MIDVFDSKLDLAPIGEQMYQLVETLYPICRSITGPGVRETMAHIQKLLPITVNEVPSGTPVFDWEVPKEWAIRDAYVKNTAGERVIDFKKSNLHVLNYSTPVSQRMTLAELRPHLTTLPEQPDWIPYRTTYYQEKWGFCLSQNHLNSLPEGDYEVVIDSTLENGSLTYGEYVIEGESTDEVLISCHTCHPSLCNDNLSGIALATYLARHLENLKKTGQKLQFNYRFLFIPGTIGSITWLALNEAKTKNIKHGLVVVCVGDAGKFSYKTSRQGDALIDRAAKHVLTSEKEAFNLIEFYPYGYDERQYCSPGFNLAVGSLSRSTHGKFPEYHSSADNLSFVSAKQIAESLEVYMKVLDVLENDTVLINQNPKCEPRLGKRGLYGNVGATVHRATFEMALLWTLNLTDGKHSLLDIAQRSKMPFETIKQAAKALLDCELLKPHPANALSN
jgi:aminopeptidase-like protein